MTETRGFDLKVFGPFCAIWEPFLSALEPREDQGVKPEAQVRQSTNAVLKSALRAELEGFALLSRRAQAYIHLPVELMTSRNPQDVFERSLAFYQTAFEQWSQSSNKVIKIWGDAAEAVCGEARRARDYIDFSQVPLPEAARTEAEERPRHRRAA